MARDNLSLVLRSTAFKILFFGAMQACSKVPGWKGASDAPEANYPKVHLSAAGGSRIWLAASLYQDGSRLLESCRFALKTSS
jgi:hypothetical protein